MIEIKVATKEDLPLIEQLACVIWKVVYEEMISPGQIDYMLKIMYNQDELLALFDDGLEFIIAYENGAVKGFCGFKIYLDKTRIEKLYVLPDQHKKGIGRLMLDYVIEKSKAVVPAIELNVNRKNKAVDFYKRHGFKILKEEDNPIGEGFFMNDYVMALIL